VSQQNVEIAKRSIDALNRRDLDAYDDLFTQDFEWFPALPSTVEGGGYLGRKGIEKYLGEISETWEEFGVIAEEYRDLGGRVLMLGRIEGRGRGSGVEVNAQLGAVWDFRDGRISRARVYLDHGEALQAAGLAE
jgi:ketosteroid isomerase-like protein